MRVARAANEVTAPSDASLRRRGRTARQRSSSSTSVSSTITAPDPPAARASYQASSAAVGRPTADARPVVIAAMTIRLRNPRECGSVTSNSAILPSALGAIGATPLVALDRLTEGLPGRVAVKLEFYGPGASVKDRAALAVVEAAERSGELKPGGTVVELTSGNMGTGLAVVCAVKGYRMIAVMSAGNSVERRRMLEALGAEVELVPQAGAPRPGQVSKEDLDLVEERTIELTRELGAFRPNQFHNPHTVEAHETGTGLEIWEQTGGLVGAFVAHIGAGGTFIGVARALKS